MNVYQSSRVCCVVLVRQCCYRLAGILLSISSRRCRTGDTAIVCERHCSCYTAHSGVSPRKAYTSGHLVLQGKPPAAAERSHSGECLPPPCASSRLSAGGSRGCGCYTFEVPPICLVLVSTISQEHLEGNLAQML